MSTFGIDTPKRQAAFLAQIAHESRKFASLRESFDYSVSGLLETGRRSHCGDQVLLLPRDPLDCASTIHTEGPT